MSEDIKYRHYQWQRNIYQWVMIRDAIAGESAIKMQSELYLPMPAAMQLSNARSPSVGYKSYDMTYQKHDIHSILNNSYNPNYHPNAPYSAYKMRAQFPEITSAILRGLIGIAMGSRPTYELPSNLEYLEEKFTKSGSSLMDFYEYALKQALSVGRLGILVDIDDEDGLPRVSSYSAESISNWVPKSGAYDEVGFKEVSLVEYEGDNEIIFKPIVNDNMYIVEKYINGKLESVDEVTFRGKRLSNIPFIAVGSTDINTDADVSPMATVARIALQIYQLDADLRQGEYMSCNPSLVISGISEEFAPKAIGSTLAIILPPSDAKAYYPSTDTSALNHVSNRIDRLFEKATQQGVALIGTAKVESGEALRIKQQANNATLASAVVSVCKGIESAIKSIAEFHGTDPNTVEFVGNTEFGAQKLTPQEQDSLVKSWMSGALSKSTMLYNFEKGGLLQEGETFEDEIDRIDDEEPVEDFNTEGVTQNGQEANSNEEEQGQEQEA